MLYEKQDEHVAQFKFTALLLPSDKTARITGGVVPVTASSEHKVEDPALVELLAISTDKKKKNNKKKKKGGGGGGDGEEAVDVE